MDYYSYRGDPLHLPQVYDAPVLMTWRLLLDLFQFKLLSPHRNKAHIQVFLLKEGSQPKPRDGRQKPDLSAEREIVNWATIPPADDPRLDKGNR